MRKILFIFAAVLLSSIGLHAQTFIVGNFRYTITHEPNPFLLFDVGTVSVSLVQYDGYVGSFVISGSAYYEQKDKWYSITAIDNNGFMRYATVTGVTVGSPVTRIGYRAFYECTGLTFATMDNTVETIGSSAFEGCTKLNTVTLCSSVKEIGASAFENCTSLKTVYCNALTPPKLDTDVFKNVPQDLSIYVFNAEAYKKSWTSLVNNIKQILIEEGGVRFEIIDDNKARVIAKEGGYTGNIVIPEQITCQGMNFAVTEIGQNAFYECKSLTSVTIPNSVTTIGKQAFYICSGLTSITIPQSVTTIEEQAFEGSSTGLTSIVVAGDNPKYDSRDNCNAIIEKATNTLILGCKHTTIPNNITTIGRSAFDGCYDLKDITIPNSVTTIGRSAFWECKSLTSVTIPNSVTTIGINAFKGTGLTSIYIPASVKEINDNAFWDCTNLKDLQFANRTAQDGAIKMGVYAFENTALEEVVIPDWITEIPEGLFNKSSKMETLYLPASVGKINSRSFENCPNLKYIISMAETPPTLVDGAFKGHDKDDNVFVHVPTSDAVSAYENSNWSKYFTNFFTELEYRIISSTDRTAEVIKAIPIGGEVYIPAVVTLKDNLYNVVGIGSDVFNYSDKDNEDLQSISLPPTMQYIGDRAFNRCVKLTQIELPVELQTIGASAFYGCTSLGSIVIPEGVQTIGKSAFMGCSKLTSISLPTGLKNIPDECFNQCPLGQEIIVPEGVETIGQTAFNGTLETRLGTKSITLPSTLKEINLGAFYYRDGLKEITCRALIPPTLTAQAFASKQFQAQQITVYVPDRDVMAKYNDNSDWKSDLYQFKFKDLMAEANKEYLRTLAGSNDTAKAIANAYCDSIDNRATTTQQVQDYTNTAAMMMDKYVFPDYKVRLCNKLDNIASTVLNAQPIADDYRQRIMDTHFRGEAENLFAEGCAKIDALKQLYDLKESCGKALRDMAQGYSGAEGIAEFYAGLIDGAATQAEVYQLYEEGKKRVAKALFTGKYWTDLGGCYVLGGFIEEK